MNDDILEGALRALLAHLRACNLWFHGAHHSTVGAGFQADHKFYGKVYAQYADEYDTATEKAIALRGIKIADPVSVASRATQILSTMPSPSGLSGHQIAAAGLNVERQTLSLLEKIFRDLENAKRLPLGLNDFLAATANAHETNVYLLGQRVAGGNAA